MPDDQKPADDAKKDLSQPREARLTEEPAEPPVVARLVIEIRSDGSRTIARGAMEDRLTGQSVAVKTEGATPEEFSRALLKQLLQAPFIGRNLGRSIGRAAVSRVARALLPGRRGDKKES